MFRQQALPLRNFLKTAFFSYLLFIELPHFKERAKYTLFLNLSLPSAILAGSGE